MKNYNNSSNPEFLNNYLVHLKVVQMLSERTISEYYFDVRLFLKYIHKNNINSDIETIDINISDMSVDELKKGEQINLAFKDGYAKAVISSKKKA